MEKFDLSMMSESKFRLKAIAKALPEIAPNMIFLRNLISDFLLVQEFSMWGCFSLISK